METAETFVTLSVHEGTNADGKNIRFIRARFQVGESAYLTAFNPKGVSKLELVKRVSRTTGKVRTQTRWPVLVRFQRDTVILKRGVGSDVVTECVLEPRAFVATAMQSAPAADLAALDAIAAAPAAKPSQAPAVPSESEEEALA